jgi:ketosteroid isomerase-like protein
MKNIFPALILISLSMSCTEKKAIPADIEQEKEKVISVLSNYKTAVEKLDTTGTAKLFAADSKVFESGSYEGNYLKYETEHLGPEFSEFASFKYYNYNISVTVDMPYAFADETYRYEILIKSDSTIAERDGAATTVLKNINGEWKILISHNSSYKGKSSHK